MLNLSVLLEDSACRHPDRDAVVLGDTRLTYAALDATANQVAHLLVDRGIRPGDKVALSCPNVPYFTAVYYGILKAGAVVVPLDVRLKRREIAAHLADSEAKAYVCFEGTGALPMGPAGWAGFADTPGCEHFLTIPAAAENACILPGCEDLDAALDGLPTTFPTVGVEPTDTAVILYPSGITGQPKGVELSHADLVLDALTCHRQFGTHPDGHDRHLVTLPLCHSFGSTVQQNAGIAAGATLILLPRFDARLALRLLESEEISFFAGVPTMYWGLLDALAHAGDVDVDCIARHLRVAVSGGAALSVEVIEEFRQRFGVSVLEGYGLSETSPLADSDRAPRPGSIGMPVGCVECRPVHEGGQTVAGTDEQVLTAGATS